jgi:hypothetical protein
MSTSTYVVDVPPSGGAFLRAWLDDVDTIVDVGARIDASSVGDGDALDAVTRLGAIASRLAAVKLALLAHVEARQAARTRTGATSTASWLRAGGVGAGAAIREVNLAGSLLAHEPTRAALSQGRINPEQAGVIAAALDGLSDQVSEVDMQAAEQRLLQAAAWSDPTALRKMAAAQAARIDPEGSGDLAARERQMLTRRELTISRDRDGMHRVVGWLDPEGAAHVLTALDPLSRPRPSTPEGQDMRSPARRRGDALVELAQIAVKVDKLPDSGGMRPTVLVTIDIDALCGRVAGSGQMSGSTLYEPLSAATARKVACDAEVLPVLLGGRSQPLDLGRDERAATRWQRLALMLRDGPTCAFPGCDRPTTWTRAHHLVHWADGGRTDLANLVLICAAHHDSVHNHGWTVVMDSRGRPVFSPPPTPPPEPPSGQERPPDG